MTAKICANCRFVIPQRGNSEIGFCHRFPSQMVAAGTGAWPPVCIKDGGVKLPDGTEVKMFASDSFCAQFKPRRRWWQLWKL